MPKENIDVQTAAKSDNLITVKEVQKILNVGRDWVYSRIRSGELTCYKLGHYLRFSSDDVKQLIQRSKKTSISLEGQ